MITERSSRWEVGVEVPKQNTSSKENEFVTKTDAKKNIGIINAYFNCDQYDLETLNFVFISFK